MESQVGSRWIAKQIVDQLRSLPRIWTLRWLQVPGIVVLKQSLKLSSASTFVPIESGRDTTDCVEQYLSNGKPGIAGEKVIRNGRA